MSKIEYIIHDMGSELERYRAIGEAIRLLLFPHAEVVIHDLGTGRIYALFNNFSKRKVGDESLLDELNGEDTVAPYFKTNWDGRKMKSVSSVLRNGRGKAIGLLCVNLDISKWEEMHRFVQDFIKPVGEGPEYLFKNDWREKINDYVTRYLKARSLNLKSLDKEETKALLHVLHKEGAFNSKNAASYIADVLNISRATVYNYLKS